MKSTLIYLLILVLGLIAIPAAHAKEGADQYPNGAENWYAGALPPPGLYFLNYLGYYHGELRDGSGKKVSLPNGSTPSVTAEFDALRFIEVTKFKILGASYGMHVIVPLVDQAMNFGGSNSTFRMGDITIDPLVLGWHGKQWHAVAGLDINLPAGHFDPNDARLCVGANYVSFEPAFAATYSTKSNWEASAKLMFNAKTTNQQSNYHSGDEFHMDYVLGKHLGPWSLGERLFPRTSDGRYPCRPDRAGPARRLGCRPPGAGLRRGAERRLHQ